MAIDTPLVTTNIRQREDGRTRPVVEHRFCFDALQRGAHGGAIRECLQLAPSWIATHLAEAKLALLGHVCRGSTQGAPGGRANSRNLVVIFLFLWDPSKCLEISKKTLKVSQEL